MHGVLDGEIRNIIALYCVETVQSRAILSLLENRGFALCPQRSCRAGDLSLRVSQSITGRTDKAAVRGAAAVELQIEAGYLFDNVADGEIDSGLGLNGGEQLALALAMHCCGAQAAWEAASCSSRDRGSQALQSFHTNYIASCAGQFLDAQLEKRAVANTDEALNMTFLKSGSLGRFAAEFGALLATDEPETIRLFGDFGFNLTTYLQLVDDVADACPNGHGDGDIAQGKKTLPLVFFHNYLLKWHPECGGIEALKEISGENTSVREDFEVSGAADFGAIVAEAFLNRAKSNLDDLHGLVKETDGLEQYVDSLVSGSTEVL